MTRNKSSLQILLISIALSSTLLSGCIRPPDSSTNTSTSSSSTSSSSTSSSNTATQTSTQEAKVQNVSIQDLAQEINNASGDYVILDVREQWEYDRGHVPGVTLIPLGELQQRMSEVPNDKTLYVICQSGVRSTTASDILLKAGKKDIRNVQGGTGAWARAGLPIE